MSGAALPYAPPYDHLVYLRVFEGCNLACKHCFIPANPKKMTQGQMSGIPGIVRQFAPKKSRILLQWHGGEPTMFGAPWLRECIDRIHQNGPDFNWSHGIQTNLITYDDQWARLYHDHFEGEVGVSWDPEIRVFNNNPDTNNKFEEIFWTKMGHLITDGLNPYLVVTATKTFFNHFKNPFEFFDKLVSAGISRVHLERVTKTGYARENWDFVGLSNLEYSRNMSRFMRSYALWSKQFKGQLTPLFISPFDGLVASAKSLQSGEDYGYGCWSGVCDTRFHTIDSNGYKAGCTALTSESDNSRANSIEVIDLLSPFASRAERRHNCSKCKFRTICSSGCLAVDIDDGSGECSGGYQLFETASQLIDHWQ